MTIEDIKEIYSFLEDKELTRTIKKIYSKMQLMIEMSELELALRDKSAKLQELSGVKKK